MNLDDWNGPLDTCPSRLESYNLDSGKDRFGSAHEWTRDEAAAQEIVRKYEEGNTPGSTRYLPYWDSEDPIPETCSYCGSVKPSDVLALLRTGRWCLERTTKSYKVYLKTVAARDRMKKWVTMVEKGADPIESLQDKVPYAFDPFLKVYLNHFSKVQINELNQTKEAQGG